MTLELTGPEQLTAAARTRMKTAEVVVEQEYGMDAYQIRTRVGWSSTHLLSGLEMQEPQKVFFSVEQQVSSLVDLIRGSIPELQVEEPKPNLGLATTQQLLDELTARIRVDYSAGGGGLDYTTVGGRP